MYAHVCLFVDLIDFFPIQPKKKYDLINLMTKKIHKRLYDCVFVYVGFI